MNRRESLRRVALMMGGTLSASTLGFVLNSCNSATQQTVEQAGFFSAEEASMVSEIAEMIIPKTDTPGAIEAKVPEFIATMLEDCYPVEYQTHFKQGLASVMQTSKDAFGKEYPELTQKQKIELVTQTDREAFTAPRPEGDKPMHFFRTMKELTLLGYFTSEAGATQALDYVPVPGRYEGCTELQPGQKAWA